MEWAKKARVINARVQGLTADTGNQHLTAQLNQVIAIMRISDNWKQFLSHFNKMVDRKNGQFELKFDDLEPQEEQNIISNPTIFDKQLMGLLNVPPEEK